MTTNPDSVEYAQNLLKDFTEHMRVYAETSESMYDIFNNIVDKINSDNVFENTDMRQYLHNYLKFLEVVFKDTNDLMITISKIL